MSKLVQKEKPTIMMNTVIGRANLITIPDCILKTFTMKKSSHRNDTPSFCRWKTTLIYAVENFLVGLAALGEALLIMKPE
jgi:hypothetical protein